MIPQSLPDRLLAYAVKQEQVRDALGIPAHDFVDQQEIDDLREAAAALSGREAVAWLEPGTLNSARPEDFAECSAKWPNDYKHWFPVFAAPQPGGGWRPIAEAAEGEVVILCDANGNRWTDVAPGVPANGCGLPAVCFQPLPAAPSAKGV